MVAFFTSFALASRVLQRSGVGHHGRATFYLLTAIPFLGYLHGACTVLVVALALINFGVAHAGAGRSWGAAIMWACNLVLLFIARSSSTFRFSSVNPSLAGIDEYRGVARWDVCFNLSLLRMLSFALDLHWRRSTCNCRPTTLCAQQQLRGCSGNTGTHLPAVARIRNQQEVDTQGATEAAEGYGVIMYLSYVLYPPLYLAGPIMTYQHFASQLRKGSKVSTRVITRYAARLGADWLCLELLTHSLYCNSIAKHQVGLRYHGEGLHYGAVEMAMTAFWVLCFMWLKFATIWRFFRLGALLDNVDPPENMRRCFANNYDIEGFWRNWHSSYNQWLVRYLYVPLGGNRRRGLVIWPVFMFVAVWHDLEWRLLVWASLICIAFLCEMAVKRFAFSDQFASWHGTQCFRHVCALGAALNISVLMAANLAGFVLGGGNLKRALWLVANERAVVASTFATFFSAATIMLNRRYH